MSNSYRDDQPASNPAGTNSPSTWDPLGWSPSPHGQPGPQSERQPEQFQPGQQPGTLPPAYQQQAYQQQAYQQQAYQQQSFQQQPYQQQPVQQPGYPPAVWVPSVPVYPYAAWIRRVGGYLIDFAPTYIAMIPFWVGYMMIYIQLIRASVSGTSDPEALLSGFTGTPLVLMGVGSVLMLAAFGWQWYNRWLIGGRTGQSMGKRVLNTKLVAEVNGQPIGPVNAFLRDLLHVLDGMAYIGYLWPLWDAKRQTFADMIMKTVVIDLRVHPSTPEAGHGPAAHGSAPDGNTSYGPGSDAAGSGGTA